MSIPDNITPAQLNVVEMLKWLENFHEPKDEVELLERALEWARDEQRWVEGSLIEWKPECKPVHSIHTSSKAKEMTDVELCTSVRACAMGILVICTYNGPIVRNWLLGTTDNDRTEFTIALGHEVLGNAVLYLARGLHPRHMIFRGNREWAISEAVRFIENKNDDFDYHEDDEKITAKNLKKHHAKIVRGFEQALEYARKDQAKNDA